MVVLETASGREKIHSTLCMADLFHSDFSLFPLSLSFSFLFLLLFNFFIFFNTLV